MAFRNPVRSLPADRITGQISGSQLAANAIDGKVVTGATVRTSAGFPRIELAPDGNLYFYTAADQEPGLIRVDGEAGTLELIGPNNEGVEYGLTFQKAFGSSSTTINTDETQISGLLRAGNLAIGRVSITPSAPNTPTSVTVSGLGLVGSVARAVATAQSQFIGVSVTGVGCTGAGPNAVAVWLCRSNTTAVLVDYFVISDA